MKAGKLIGVFIIGMALTGAHGGELHESVDEAISILSNKQNSDDPIPPVVLEHAKAIGIIEVTKGAFGVGGENGDGIIVVRQPFGWSVPIAFSQGGGSVGFQVGVSVKRYIYVFTTEESWREFLGKDRAQFKAAAEANAGADAVATELANGLPLEPLYIYTDFEGAYAGAAIGGELVGNDEEANLDKYGTSQVDEILSRHSDEVPYAQPLYRLLNAGVGSPK